MKTPMMTHLKTRNGSRFFLFSFFQDKKNNNIYNDNIQLNLLK